MRRLSLCKLNNLCNCWEWNHGTVDMANFHFGTCLQSLDAHNRRQNIESRMCQWTACTHISHAIQRIRVVVFQHGNNATQRNAIRLLNGSSMYFAYSAHAYEIYTISGQQNIQTISEHGSLFVRLLYRPNGQTPCESIPSLTFRSGVDLYCESFLFLFYSLSIDYANRLNIVLVPENLGRSLFYSNSLCILVFDPKWWDSIWCAWACENTVMRLTRIARTHTHSQTKIYIKNQTWTRQGYYVFVYYFSESNLYTARIAKPVI